MKKIRFCILIALALVQATAAGAVPVLYEYAGMYTYQSRYDQYGYAWSLRNESTAQAIVGWTWGGGNVGDVPGAVYTEAYLPLPPDTGGPRPWFNVRWDGMVSPMTTDSIIAWADGSTVTVPIYVPAVPEPSGVCVLGVGLAGVLICRPRRRRRQNTASH
jgi:hypothetical protein